MLFYYVIMYYLSSLRNAPLTSAFVLQTRMRDSKARRRWVGCRMGQEQHSADCGYGDVVSRVLHQPWSEKDLGKQHNQHCYVEEEKQNNSPQRNEKFSFWLYSSLNSSVLAYNNNNKIKKNEPVQTMEEIRQH